MAWKKNGRVTGDGSYDDSQLIAEISQLKSTTDNLEETTLQIGENVNALQSQFSKIEVLTEDPASPSVGQIWLREDL